MKSRNELLVELICTSRSSVTIEQIEIQEGATIRDVFFKSKIGLCLSFLVPKKLSVGVFGKEKPLDCQLDYGDRVEIYRKLRRSPKEIRRQRAKEAKE